jgi:predicted Zn-dependent protease with MMP-like domain
MPDGSRALAARRGFRKARRIAKVLLMNRRFGLPPRADEIQAIALAALAALPQRFAAHIGEIVLSVEELADEGTLEALDIEDAFELTGLYEGVPLTERSIDQSGTLPDRIRLFRAAILDEWAARSDETLEDLVAHILIHEVGHHFGLSDADIHEIEKRA